MPHNFGCSGEEKIDGLKVQGASRRRSTSAAERDSDGVFQVQGSARRLAGEQLRFSLRSLRPSMQEGETRCWMDMMSTFRDARGTRGQVRHRRPSLWH